MRPPPEQRKTMTRRAPGPLERKPVEAGRCRPRTTPFPLTRPPRRTRPAPPGPLPAPCGDHGIISVLGATGIRLCELAGSRYDADHRLGGDIELWRREIAVRGKGSRTRIVKISHETARSLDRYIRIRPEHAQAYRPQL